MLFSIKNKLFPSLFLFVAFVVGAFFLRYILGLTWQLKIYQGIVRDLILWLSMIVSSDIILHFILWFVLGNRYLVSYRALVEHFRPQSALNIAASGLLAASEELVFRGVLLEELMNEVGMETTVAVVISALVFGLLHTIQDRRLAPFALWVIWEGALLGWIYVATGSLLVCMLLHAIHDVGGFSFFAFQRRTGWLLKRGDF